VLLHELESAREHIAEHDLPGAVDRLHRARCVELLLAQHLDALRTLSTESFEILRERLGTSSGFQSAQFREIEYLSGCKDSRYLASSYFSPAERERLARRYREPSLSETFQQFLDNRGIVDLPDALRRDHGGELTDLVAALVAHDRGFQEWRSRHMDIVGRFIGGKPGTGGTAGLSYLHATLDRRFFPDLWEI
jgi:tryptophan 2,3-dioxygenase